MPALYLDAKTLYKMIALSEGLALGIGVVLIPPPEGFTLEAWHLLGLTLWMAFWWLTEIIPVYVTALLPLVVLPILGRSDFKATAAPYAHPLIFLFMGGFIAAKAIEPWNLHQRIALIDIRAFGTRSGHLVGGFMIATAFLRMWISNTTHAFGTALFLGIAYAARVGGLGALVGSPPNGIGLASERLAIAQMARVGFYLNLVAVLVIVFVTAIPTP